MTLLKPNQSPPDNAVDYVKTSEGFRGGLYLDAEGYPTIGYGCRVSDLPFPLLDNAMDDLDGSGDWLPEPVAAYWLQHRLEQCVTQAMDDIGPEAWRAMDSPSIAEMRRSHLQEFGTAYPCNLDDEVVDASPRQTAVMDFNYHNGSMVNFPGLKAAIAEQDWERAAKNLRFANARCGGADDPLRIISSRETAYYTKHTKRAERNMWCLRTGAFPPEEMW